MAINMALSIKKDSECHLIISDSSNNSSIYANNARNLSVFKSVYYIKHKNFLKKTNYFRKKILVLLYYFLRKNPFYKQIKGLYFDELIAYNLTQTLTFLLRQLTITNPNIKCSRMEEGLISYNYIDNDKISNNRISNFFFNHLGFNEFIKRQKELYCIYPECYKGKLKTVKIPKIDIHNKDFIDSVNTVFGIKNLDLKYYQKYILFTSILDMEGGKPIEELNFSKKIANLIGKDNLLIKVHPRDNVERFIKEGLIVDTNSSIPWEAIQLNYDFSNHIFLSICSSSVLSINLVLNKPTKTFFLLPLTHYKDNDLAKKTWDNLLKLFNFESIKDKLSEFVFIPNDINEIFSDK